MPSALRCSQEQLEQTEAVPAARRPTRRDALRPRPSAPLRPSCPCGASPRSPRFPPPTGPTGCARRPCGSARGSPGRRTSPRGTSRTNTSRRRRRPVGWTSGRGVAGGRPSICAWLRATTARAPRHQIVRGNEPAGLRARRPGGSGRCEAEPRISAITAGRRPLHPRSRPAPDHARSSRATWGVRTSAASTDRRPPTTRGPERHPHQPSADEGVAHPRVTALLDAVAEGRASGPHVAERKLGTKRESAPGPAAASRADPGRPRRGRPRPMPVGSSSSCGPQGRRRRGSPGGPR